jgi:hypothetical protein
MIKLSQKEIEKALLKIEVGLDKYLWLQNKVWETDVSKDREFQKKFNGFYRVRRNIDWQKDFFNIFEDSKYKKDDFEKIITKLQNKTNKIEASFTSKLIATLNPKMPVIDKMVFSNLGLKLPSTKVKNRISIISKQYEFLTSELNKILLSDDGKFLTKQFTQKYPKAKIEKMKMLDFVLWQMRD